MLKIGIFMQYVYDNHSGHDISLSWTNAMTFVGTSELWTQNNKCFAILVNRLVQVWASLWLFLRNAWWLNFVVGRSALFILCMIEWCILVFSEAFNAFKNKRGPFWRRGYISVTQFHNRLWINTEVVKFTAIAARGLSRCLKWLPL